MNVLIKIIVAAINLACLLVGLAFPNSATPMTILPPLVTSSSWIFTSARENRRPNIPQILLLILACVVGIGCFFIGTTCKLEANEKHQYFMRFDDNTALLGGRVIPYDVIVCMILVVFITLTITEICMSFAQRKKQQRTSSDFEQGAEMALKI